MPVLIDKRLVRERFRRSLKSYARHAVVQNAMAAGLSEMVCREHPGRLFERVLEVGSGTGALTAEMLKRSRVNLYYANDIVEESRLFLDDVIGNFPGTELRFFAGDIESCAALPSELDCVVSNATLQWLQDLDGLFNRISRCIRPGGLLAFSTFGPSNMREIADIENIGLVYRSLEELERLAGRYFELVESREEEIVLEFSTPELALRHIRETGVNGITRRLWTKSRYMNFLESYRQRFASGSGVSLTYHPVYCCLKKKMS